MEALMKTRSTTFTFPDYSREITAIHLRNVQALTEAQQAVLEGFKSLLQRQLEIIQSALEESMKAAQDIMSDPDLKSNVAKRFDATKAAMLSSAGNANILSEMAARSNAQAAGILQNRALEALDEVKAAVGKALAA
jgi:phasin family protein